MLEKASETKGRPMERLTREIGRYRCRCEQEERDRDEILRRITSGENLLTRDNASAHFTASAWICNESHDKVLMCYHRIYDSWSWLGGHADGDSDLRRVALREVREESGLGSAHLITDDPISLEILCVEGHVRKGVYVSCHLHLNLTYLVEADEEETLKVCEAENAALKWFSPDGAIEASTEPWFRRWIYPKLNDRLNELG